MASLDRNRLRKPGTDIVLEISKTMARTHTGSIVTAFGGFICLPITRSSENAAEKRLFTTRAAALKFFKDSGWELEL